MKGTDWISVGERMPEDEQPILVLIRYWSEKYDCWRWEIKQDIYFDQFGLRAYYPPNLKATLTHWMPIVLPDNVEDGLL